MKRSNRRMAATYSFSDIPLASTFVKEGGSRMDVAKKQEKKPIVKFDVKSNILLKRGIDALIPPDVPVKKTAIEQDIFKRREHLDKPKANVTATIETKSPKLPEESENTSHVVQSQETPTDQQNFCMDIDMDKLDYEFEVPASSSAMSVDSPKSITQFILSQKRFLKRALTPKNALQTLNEMRLPDKNEFDIEGEMGNFTAILHLNGKTFRGSGPNKSAAKTQASALGIREYCLDLMAKYPIQYRYNRCKFIDLETGIDGEDVGENEVPMMLLAGYAIHRIFLQWESEGIIIPDFKTGAQAPPGSVIPRKSIPEIQGSVQNSSSITDNNISQYQTQGTLGTVTPYKAGIKSLLTVKKGTCPRKLKTAADLPADASCRNPTTLLSFMRPNALYEDLEISGRMPDVEFKIRITVDDMKFIGIGKSKKEARKVAAAQVATTLWNLQFVENT